MSCLCSSRLQGATVGRCAARTPTASPTKRQKQPAWSQVCERVIWCVRWCPRLPSRQASMWGGSPCARLAPATSRPMRGRCRASTFGIVGRSTARTATATRKERRRFLPRRKRQGFRAATMMSNAAFTREARDRIEIEVVYPHPIERAWHAPTDADALARWLMPNDFAPRLGHHFTFRAEGEWTGTIACEVVALEPPTRVAYTWASGPLRPPTLVTWMLASEGEGEGEGTPLRLVHPAFAAS